MSKTVDYFKKKYDKTLARMGTTIDAPDFNKMTSAILVLTAYGAKNQSTHEQMANFMARILDTMIFSASTFAERIRDLDNQVFSYFIFALKQTLGFIDLNATTTEDTIIDTALIMTREQKIALYAEFIHQLEQSTSEVQKNLLGVMISLYVNKFSFTRGNSGFASACFVVAKELQLQNISQSVWHKLITAANFPSHFLGGKTSSARRAAEIAQLTAPPAYSINSLPGQLTAPSAAPPTYSINPLPGHSLLANYESITDQPPEYTEPDQMEEHHQPPPAYPGDLHEQEPRAQNENEDNPNSPRPNPS